jgi:hypothetical protein
VEAIHEICVRKNSEMHRPVTACSTTRDMMTFVAVAAATPTLFRW